MPELSDAVKERLLSTAPDGPLSDQRKLPLLVRASKYSRALLPSTKVKLSRSQEAVIVPLTARPTVSAPAVRSVTGWTEKAYEPVLPSAIAPSSSRVYVPAALSVSVDWSDPRLWLNTTPPV